MRNGEAQVDHRILGNGRGPSSSGHSNQFIPIVLLGGRMMCGRMIKIWWNRHKRWGLRFRSEPVFLDYIVFIHVTLCSINLIHVVDYRIDVWWRTKNPDAMLQAYKIDLQHMVGSKLPVGLLKLYYRFSYRRRVRYRLLSFLVGPDRIWKILRGEFLVFVLFFWRRGSQVKFRSRVFFCFVWSLHAFCSLGLCIVLTSFPLVNGRPLITFSFVFACIQGLKKVRATGIGVHTPEEIIKMGTDDLKVLADMLGEKTFFFGDEPTTVNITSLSLLHSLLPTRWNESLMVLFYVCFLSQLYSARRRGFL